MNWYVLKTKPKKELEVRNRLQAASFDVFLPTMKGLISSKPLFPSYLFIKADLAYANINRLVRFTRGVNRVLGDSEGPQPIANLIVETLRERTKDGSLIEQEVIFKGGDEVRMKRGILKDLIGIIEKNIPEAGRIRILFKWLNISMQAEVRYTELEKVA